MDRLPWSGFHWRVVIALGITWVLEGVEIGHASAIGDTLRHEETLGLSAEVVGISAGVYLAGEVVGALYFGRQADKLGRRRLFIVTLALYVFLSSWNDFMWPLIILADQDLYTLPVALAANSRQNVQDYEIMMAGAVVTTLPVLILFLALQRYYLSGLLTGSVKG